jgi:hypothetical protein
MREDEARGVRVDGSSNQEALYSARSWSVVIGDRTPMARQYPEFAQSCALTAKNVPMGDATGSEYPVFALMRYAPRNHADERGVLPVQVPPKYRIENK